MSTTQSQSITELAKALATVQGALQPAAKEAVNPHFRSKYADLPAVWDACRALLTKAGLSVVQMPVEAGAGRVGLTTMLLHASGEYISSTVSTALQNDNAQGVGSALTYLRRYSLAAMVGIVADDDDDGNKASEPRPARTTYEPPRPQAAPHAAAKPNGNPVARAMDLFNIARENGVQYRAPGKFKDMPPQALQAEIEKLERLISEAATPIADSEWDEIDANN